MASLADSLVSSAERVLSIYARSDLEAKRATYLGRSYWIVKDPIGILNTFCLDVGIAFFQLRTKGFLGHGRDIRERGRRQFDFKRKPSLQYDLSVKHRDCVRCGDSKRRKNRFRLFL